MVLDIEHERIGEDEEGREEKKQKGKLESVGEDGISAPLYEGSVCGEELLTWCLEHPLASKGTFHF